MFFFRNFKNFAEAKLDYDKPVTLVVGPNGSGKSNLIEGVELLAFLASGKPLHEITDVGREGGLEIRGGLDACACRGCDSFTLGFQGNITIEDKIQLVTYEISVRVGKQPRICAETLRLDGREIPVFEVLQTEEESSSADNEVRYDNNSKGKFKPTASVAGDRSALSQYTRFARGNKKIQQTLLVTDAVSLALSAPSVFDPTPRLMRGYERVSESRLARNGFNISPALYALSRARMLVETDPVSGKRNFRSVSNKETISRILNWITQLPDEPFADFNFIRTRADDVIFGFKLKDSEETVTARLLSDGTLRALAVLTALETSKKGRRIIIEEFDNGVHPSRVQILAGALFDASERNGLRTLVTTHNPATLNALTVSQLDSVLLTVQDPAAKRSRLLPLTDLPGYIEFIEKGRLGDLITRRVYEQHLRENYEGQRKEDINKWLETLP